MIELIDKKDSFEIIRDMIVMILVTEIENQQLLAVQSGKDPDDWKIKIFSEKSRPIEEYLNDCGEKNIPIVNVWFDSSSFNLGGGNPIQRQTSETTYNIDCYGPGVSSTNLSGHIPGDTAAAKNSHKAVRLVRNILMAGEYTYLNLRGTVWRRWISSISTFQPVLDGVSAQNIVGSRISFNVKFNELSPQIKEEVLEQISTSITEIDTGQILANIDF